MTSHDPIRARRGRIARYVRLAQRVGYAALLVAIGCFLAAAILEFPSGLVTATIVALVVAIVVLPVPIVMSYGIRAAEREDRGRGEAGPG
ncbi:MAG: hypothetical protein ACRDWD_06445 [Acidimicrobiia bacterium]